MGIPRLNWEIEPINCIFFADGIDFATISERGLLTPKGNNLST
jgi:hypothetical protein